jgi:N-acyl-D-amino-acid deacylase
MASAVRHRRIALDAALLTIVAFASACAPVEQYDVLITNAAIVDGTGVPSFRADIVRGDTIVAVAPTIDAEATRTIDAAGLTVAPGFIDLHVHALGSVGPAPTVLPIVEVPTADNYVRQGVTTLIAGPDGFSPVPLQPALDDIRNARITPNLGAFVGHGSIRQAVIGNAIAHRHVPKWIGCGRWCSTRCAAGRSA